MLNAINTLLQCKAMRCEFRTYSLDEVRQLKDDNVYQTPHGVTPDNEFAVITCHNGYRYFVNVEGNSDIQTFAAIFETAASK